MPQQIVDADLQGRCATTRIDRRNVSEGRLLELKALVHRGGIATARDFSDRLAVGCGGNVGVDRNGGAVIATAQRRVQCERGAVAVALYGARAMGNRGDFADDRVVFQRGLQLHCIDWRLDVDGGAVAIFEMPQQNPLRLPCRVQ